MTLPATAVHALGPASDSADAAARALVEPVLMAAGWFEQPPLILLGLVLVTIGLFAFSHREAPPQIA